ncbi:MAG: type II toxin-antitoxin system HicB family antitoxin [candidate division WOR-3 bacterium]
MIKRYIFEAMQRAKYKMLDDGTFYGWVDELPGVWANKETLEECRNELEAVIDDWLLLGLRLGHTIPPLGDIDLNVDLAKAI